MKYGYMPSFQDNLLEEISFAKKHFDYMEFTLRLDFPYTSHFIRKFNSMAGNFPRVGHLHWEFDISENKASEIKRICLFIGIFKKMQVKEIVIHTSANKSLKIKQVLENNLNALLKISAFCRKNSMNLYLENIATKPFNEAYCVNYLAEKLKLNIALDTGHALETSEKNYKDFLKLGRKIKHIHMHSTRKGFDHLPFSDENEMKKVLMQIKKINYKGRITLEMFYKIEKNKRVSLVSKERKLILLHQLKIIKSFD